MANHLRTAIAPAYLMLCLVLGGASAEGFWVNLVLQVIGVAIIAWALLARRKTQLPTASRQLLGIAALAALLVAVQLIPLPPSIWTKLPGRDQILDAFLLLELPPPWMPISLAPMQTIYSGIWLLPSFALLLAVVRLGGFKAAWIAWSILITTGAAVIVGALQKLGAGSSKWDFYEINSVGSANGFFANSNHMATLLLVAVPFVAALYIRATAAGRSTQRAPGLLVILAGVLAVIVVGLILNGSLAGLGLAVPVVAVSILMIVSRLRKLRWWSAAIPVLLAIGAVYAVLNGPFGNNLIGEEASTHGSRQESFAITIRAARDYFPVGSGIGTFNSIYRTYENRTQVDSVYMNHAHSDLLEVLLETGALGLFLIGIFLFWWIKRIFAIWAAPSPDAFASAATIASAAILAHSLVDYPLRTAALSAVFAVCCALMAEPRSSVRIKEAKGKNAKHLTAD